MEEEFGADGDGTGPSRAQAVGGGRVTGPGEAIADSGKWMRLVAYSACRRIEGRRGKADIVEGYLRGHGTYVQDEKVLASVAGTLERVNKLVSVRPLRTK